MRDEGEDKVGVQNQHPSPLHALGYVPSAPEVARFQQALDPLPPQGAKGRYVCVWQATWLGQEKAMAVVDGE